MKYWISLIAKALLCWMPVLSADDGEGGLISWQPWTDTLFEQAKRKNRLVILDLEAVWCHWCHVMDQKTYANPEVAKLINRPS